MSQQQFTVGQKVRIISSVHNPACVEFIGRTGIVRVIKAPDEKIPAEVLVVVGRNVALCGLMLVDIEAAE